MSRTRRRGFLLENAGATAVEFALVVGPLLLLVFGSVEFGRAMWTREALQSVAIAGARCMGVRETACAPTGTYDATATINFITARARELYVALPATDVTVNETAECSGSDGFSRVTIAYTFESLVAPFLNAIDDIDLSADACFPNQ